MVARSNVARARLYHYIFRLFLSFFSLATLLRRRKTDIPETFPHDVA